MNSTLIQMWSADILSASVRSTLSSTKKIALKTLFALRAQADRMSARRLPAKPRLFSLVSVLVALVSVRQP